MNDARSLVAGRVAALRARHFVIVAILGALSAGAWALPVSQAQVGGKIFFSVAFVAAAVWQVYLGLKIGRGLALVDAAPRVVVWVYPLRAFINGAEVARGIMVGTETGDRRELPITLDPGDVDRVMGWLRERCPRATFGFDAATEARFVADPKALAQRAASS